ncbi:hypothetical protein TBLA_0A06330 [Henningerozyma blattae CBS 6284]|uniref:E3 ubiquitin protein ligase n=1 Tax=Henningerozyma blattae (strain ATCC 34711 / CBS 6284 / DSM 70876 / NBRC 10599 / NRRL Y-10934 / UCD 77-7) TaxID=1071380 RepID=I2GWC2_HENB6|nr:hypothetical protein TBLA_0A06330 [Tetrapisispora blattae CBS 6284]CCH58424.1 hypothetical protein TBLA_0A06330 [Tetrapisispora blattae CBS 6284]
MSEPKQKRIKLSPPDGPLTQQDAISFQKEALFRCLHQYKTDLAALTLRFDTLNGQFNEVTKKVSSLMSIISIWIDFIKVSISDSNDISFLESLVDETIILENSSTFISILKKYTLPNNTQREVIDTLSKEILDQLQKTTSLKDDLLIQNKNLNDQLINIQSFYKQELKSIDRSNSSTLKRVYQKELQKEPVKEPIEELKEEKSTSPPSVDQSQLEELNLQIEELKLTIEHLQKDKEQNESQLVELRQQLLDSASSSKSTTIEPSPTLIEKINFLTSENKQLSLINEEFLNKFQKLNNENELFTNKLRDEFKSAQDTLYKHNSSLEKDLVRIRTTRDELLSKIAILETERTTSELIQDAQRVLELLQSQSNQPSHATTGDDALKKELQDLEEAFKELSNLTNKKYSHLLNHESIITKLNVEKTKADQKYFAAMRSKDSILIENKNLSKSLNKSNELIIQLKDSDRLLQQKFSNLNQQLETSQNNEKKLMISNKKNNLKLIDLESQLNKLNKRLEILKDENLKSIKESTHLQLELQTKDLESKKAKTKINHLQSKLERLEKSLYSTNDNSPNNQLIEELNNFRNLVYCSLCSKNWKNMAIKTCGHVFCDNCCKGRLASRMRKCPTCNKAFSSNDLLPIHL